MKSRRFGLAQRALVVLSLAWLLVGQRVLAETPPASGPTSVKIEAYASGWRLLRNGQPFFVKGAVGWSRFDDLTAAGANAVRLGASLRQLDQAHRAGLVALVGLPLGIPRAGFDYHDGAEIIAQRERILGRVMELKDHPAVLLWAIGNEPTIFTPADQRAVLWKEVNRIAEMIHSLDARHPVIAVVGGEQWREHLDELDRFCPALDAVGLNAYADMLSLPEDLARQGWRRPYLITEFGPRGHWQVAKTSWQARMEDNSTEKAAFYRRAYEHAVKGRPQCLGSFAFLWGWKMEKTHTWYGMFLEDGSRTEAVDVMTHLWSERWPANRCPKFVSPIRLTTPEGKIVTDAGVIIAGTRLRCAVDISDPDGDTLVVEWDLRRDVADDPRVGGDYEPLEPPIANAVVESVKGQALIQLPAQPGKYRVFVYARDGQGGAATANVPIQTKQPQP